MQFWQLKKADGKVSSVLFFQPYTYPHTLRRLITLIVCRNSPHYPSFSPLLEVATKTPQQAPPRLGRGALCADSMGLYVHSSCTLSCAKNPKGGKPSR